MRIRDYLGLNREKEAELKPVAVFARAEGVHDPGRPLELSPFDRAMIERSALRTGRRPEEEIPFPASASVCLSNACTHNCSGCAHGSDRKSEDAFLDGDGFERLLSCLRSLKIKFIDLRGGGEPTTHPEFDRFAKMCRQEGFGLSLLTNGAWLDPTTAGLLGEGFSFLVVNLDASNDEVYDRVHRPPGAREFQKVLANVDRVVGERNRGGSELTVGVQMRLCQANVNFMEQTTGLARDMGVDYIQFRIDQKAPDALLSDQIDQVNSLILELRHEYGPFPVYGEIRSRRTTGGGCSASLDQLVVDSSGDVYPCPHFAKLPQVACFGNIFALPPERLWFGAHPKTAVQQLRKFDCPVRHCRWRIYGGWSSAANDE